MAVARNTLLTSSPKNPQRVPLMNIKKSACLLLLISATSHPVYAGSSDAVIECKSGSGRTSLTFLDQDIQGHFQGGTFTIDKKTIKYLKVIIHFFA